MQIKLPGEFLAEDLSRRLPEGNRMAGSFEERIKNALGHVGESQGGEGQTSNDPRAIGCLRLRHPVQSFNMML